MSCKDSRKFKFKSTGTISADSDILDEVEDANFLPIGIKFPISRSSEAGSTFEMTTSYKENIKQNFISWMRTNWGERLGEHQFGANLIEILPELVQNNNQNAIRETITQGIATYFPYITLENFQVLSFEETPSFDVYTIRVIYSAENIFKGPDSFSITLKYMRV
jgi:phage baseplate assembly protein W